MKMNIKVRSLLFASAFCVFCALTACSDGQQDKTDVVVLNSGVLSEQEEQSAKTEQITAIYSEICKGAAGAASPNYQETMQTIVERLGVNGYTAVDTGNQIDMTNAERVADFCRAVDAKEKAELTIIEIMNVEIMNVEIMNEHDMNAEDAVRKASCEFRKYDFQTENGRVDIARAYYSFDDKGNLVSDDTVKYFADLWQYTEEGYLVFAGSYFADDYYIISLADASEYTALRVEPLDTKCRDLYRKYIWPVGYEDNNLFLVNWTETDFGKLDFYDLFDRFYPMLYQQPVPYKASDNPGIGMVYRIEEKEFESVVGTYLNADVDTIRSKTVYFPEKRMYAYRPRGFYEIGYTNMPYPEVTAYAENSDGTVTLTVNAVFPYEGTSKAFSHEVVVRPLENGGFQYVSNRIIGGDYDAWWRAERLTDSEWEEVYVGVYEEDDSLWYLPHAQDCLLTESEREEIQDKVLTASGQVTEVYQYLEIEEGASYASNVKNFSKAQCREVAALLGKAGYISVAEDANMENYQAFELFYDEYRNGRDAMVTVYNVNRDGLIGAVTFIYRKTDEKDALQTYYVGVGWKEGGVPTIKNTLVSDVEKINLTEKGYFIYTYKESIVHSDANQYWRVRPLSEACRELTGKYVSGLSFANYNAFVVNWDGSNADDILMPCMFEDIYRIDTGENITPETEWISAEVYERIMMTYFPVSREQLRSKCGYDEGRQSYPYEMIFASPHAPFGEVVDYTEHSDGTITLYVDGVWIDYDSDCAFTNEIVVQPFTDGTFRYLSNKIQPKKLELPTIASTMK